MDLDPTSPFDDVDEPLPFSEKKQDAVLGYLLTHEQFFLQARTKLLPEWFIDSWNSRLWKMALSFFDRFRRFPRSPAEFEGSTEFLAVPDNAERNRLMKKHAQCRIAVDDFGLDALRADLTEWMQSRVLKATLESVAEKFNASQTNPTKMREALDALRAAGTRLDRTTFELDQVVAFDDFADGSFWKERQADLEDALTFGLPLLDQKLNRSCVGNASLLRGDMTVLLAPTNIGKTTCMLTVARHNLERQKSVLLVTHEGRPSDIKTKLIQCITGMNADQLMNLPTTAEGRQRLTMIQDHVLKPYMVYLPLNRPGLTVEDTESAIRRQQEKRISETGRGFDLIIDDYPAKLTTAQASRGFLQKRSVDELIYNYFTQLALEFKCHVLSAIQTNREGSKINRQHKGAEHRLLSMEDVMESFGAMTTATNVISLNRDPVAEAAQRQAYHICKSRSNETGWTIVTRTNYGVSLTHGGGLKATGYRGPSPMHEQIDGLIEQHSDQILPSIYFNI